MREEEVRRIYVFSAGLRIWHWINFLSVITLFLTGLYIGNPFFSGPSGFEATYAYERELTMGMLRKIHFIAGYLLLGALIFRFLIALFSKRDRLFLPNFWRRSYWISLKEMTLRYLLLMRDDEGHECIRNACARTAYPLLYLLLLFMVATGFALFGMSNPGGFWSGVFGWILPFLGGEFEAHLWHRWVAWLIIIFALLHVYFVIREEVVRRNGEVSSMFNGYKFFRKEPLDIGDLE